MSITSSCQPWVAFAVVGLMASLPALGAAAEAGQGDVYSVVEIAFAGPPQSVRDSPARDVDLRVRFRHESGSPEHTVHGFWDGGATFKVRFCPTKLGRWDLVEVRSNARELNGQHQGDHVLATPSAHHGFWEVDAESAGRRWYRRSDGSHPYIIGNTHYSFLSGYQKGGTPSGNDVAADVRANAKHFKKLRLGLFGDHYPHPSEKPFFDRDGKPTDSGDFSHRPNPQWFARVDLAVQTAFKVDLIADLILAGPDTVVARSTLVAGDNNGDPTPYLRYIAARYGSYPNVWICLANEYDIKTPRWPEADIARFGQIIRGHLPYPTPLSVHASQYPGRITRTNDTGAAWSPRFDALPPWNDHQILQRKLKRIAPAADVVQQTWQNAAGKEPRTRPTINDELSYQGAGDRHTEEDTLSAHLGAFLGGGYGSTGHKDGQKTGQYFAGNFNVREHTAAPKLGWLREQIDANVAFWKMAPDKSIFPGLDPAFRAMAWPGHEYVLGTDQPHKGVVAELPPGTWTVRQFDIVQRKESMLTERATGRFTFDAPDSRAVLFHFKKTSP